LGIT
jgi:hypothetical protein